MTSPPSAFARSRGHRPAFRTGMVIGIALLLLLTLAAPTSAADPGGRLDTVAIDRFVTDYRERTGLPGVAVAVTNGDQVVHVKGYGHDSAGTPMTADTPLPVASVSKSFTALAVMQLVEAGRIALDTPVRTYLPAFTLDDPRAARITVRQLLNQTSGMADTTFAEKTLPQPDSLKGAVARLRDAGLAATPGAEFNYHNPNYHVAARLVEVVSGQPFAAYLQQHLLGPAGMSHSATIANPNQVRGLAEGYVRAYGATIARPEPDGFGQGSAGVVTTARDLAQWLILQTTGGTAANGARVAAAGSITQMHNPSTPDGAYGLGWETPHPERGAPRQVRHNGVWFTFSATQVLLPASGYGIAVLTTTGLGSGGVDSDAIADGLVALATGQTPATPQDFGSVIDLVLAAVTLLTLAFGIGALVRARGWARRRSQRPLWRAVLRLLPYAFPVLVFAWLPEVVSVTIGGGRDINWIQLVYFWASLVVWIGTAALLNVGIITRRSLELARSRRANARPERPRRAAVGDDLVRPRR